MVLTVNCAWADLWSCSHHIATIILRRISKRRQKYSLFSYSQLKHVVFQLDIDSSYS
jgi:hypothetical protein